MEQRLRIICDNREKLPYWKRGVITKKLDVGDYSFEGMEDIVVFERKSLPDLFGTVGKGHKRFKKEIQRALDKGTKFIMVIEGSREQIKNKDFPGSYHTRMKGYVVLKILDTLQSKYGIEVVYCNNRNNCKLYIKNYILDNNNI